MTTAIRTPAHVLIVDDLADNRMLMKIILAHEGYVVTIAESGTEALALVTAQPPDLILLDVMMPDPDGYEVARRIRAAAATRHVQILLVSARHDEAAMMSRTTADGVLLKPFSRPELCKRVREQLGLPHPIAP